MKKPYIPLYILISCTLFVVFLVVFFQYFLGFSVFPISDRYYKRIPDKYVELYFIDHKKLPKMPTSSDFYQFTFRIKNQEGYADDISYKVSQKTTVATKILSEDRVFLADQAEFTSTILFEPDKQNENTITVELTDRDQFINFKMEPQL